MKDPVLVNEIDTQLLKFDLITDDYEWLFWNVFGVDDTRRRNRIDAMLAILDVNDVS